MVQEMFEIFDCYLLNQFNIMDYDYRVWEFISYNEPVTIKNVVSDDVLSRFFFQ